MNVRGYVIVTIVIASIVSCSSDKKPTNGGGGMPNTIVEPEKYFPIGQGDTWFYFSPNSGNHTVRTVSGDTTIVSMNFNDSALCARVSHNGVTSEAWTVDSTGFRLYIEVSAASFDSL